MGTVHKLRHRLSCKITLTSESEILEDYFDYGLKLGSTIHLKS